MSNHVMSAVKPVSLMALLLAATESACSGGGGGMTSSVSTSAPSTTTTTTTTTNTTTTTTPNVGSDTGIAGTVGMPGAAGFGTTSVQLATAGGPTFDGSAGGYPSNVIFPLLVASLQKSSTGLSSVSTNQGATATVVITSSTKSTMQLTIPSLGLDQTLTFNTNLVSHLGQVTDGLSYVVMGEWLQRANQPSNPGTLQNSSVFVFGYETAPAAMPTSGTASFSGGPGSAVAFVYKPENGEIQSAYVEGSASISANFGTGSVTGSLTKMQISSQQSWNDVSVTANIAAGTNRFSGSTAAASSPATSFSLTGSATGRIDGAFYGPAAQNLGAVWSLSDGNGSAIGTVVAGH